MQFGRVSRRRQSEVTSALCFGARHITAPLSVILRRLADDPLPIPVYRFAQAGRLSVAVLELQCGASFNAWTPGCDVLGGEAYLNWVIGFCALHFVSSPTLKSKIRGCAADKLYYCECCMVVVASWCHVKSHVLCKKHKLPYSRPQLE